MESSIAEFLPRKYACELLPTNEISLQIFGTTFRCSPRSSPGQALVQGGQAVGQGGQSQGQGGQSQGLATPWQKPRVLHKPKTCCRLYLHRITSLVIP